jgi:hypothetical protein
MPLPSVVRVMYPSARFLGVLLILGLVSCTTPNPTGTIVGPTYTGPARTFQSSFESVDDFDGFFVVPQNSFGSSHDLLTSQVLHGLRSHEAWVLTANDTDNDSHDGYKPHRAYPTIQLQKTPDGIYRTPCLVTLSVRLDMALADRAPGIDDWMSFVTLTPDSSEAWQRTVLVNLEHDGYLHLMHVPDQGQQTFTFQRTDIPFPQLTWVRLDLYIDFGASNGAAALWQDGVLICEAAVSGGAGGLAQAHFGLYASAAVAAGTVWNDALRIREVADRAEAESLVAMAWP